jgi:hypothetical protein
MSGKGKPVRGSAKTFKFDVEDHAELSSVLGLSRLNHEVKWWWKYGQPQIDRIVATVEVDAATVGSFVGQLAKLNSNAVQINTHVFPYGIPNPYPEGFRVEVEIAKNA